MVLCPAGAAAGARAFGAAGHTGGQRHLTPPSPVLASGPALPRLLVRRRSAGLACLPDARDCSADPELTKEVVAGVLAVELQHTFKTEDVRDAEYFLYRRIKLFVDVDSTAREHLARWFRVQSGHTSQAWGFA